MWAGLHAREKTLMLPAGKFRRICFSDIWISFCSDYRFNIFDLEFFSIKFLHILLHIHCFTAFQTLEDILVGWLDFFLIERQCLLIESPVEISFTSSTSLNASKDFIIHCRVRIKRTFVLPNYHTEKFKGDFFLFCILTCIKLAF